MSTAAPIYVVNRSTLVSDHDVHTMVAAVDAQMHDHVEPAWGLPRIRILPAVAASGVRVITVVDTVDDPQALGYHSEHGPAQYGVVGCKPELDQGARPLTGPYSVASILSHEVMEMAVDGRCNMWADTGKGFLVALEVGDPVQSDHYDIGGVTVSNFVRPEFFDPNTPAGSHIDHLGVLAEPFTLSRGGYWVQMAGGRVTQKFTEQMPDWLVAMKSAPATRTQRRGR